MIDDFVSPHLPAHFQAVHAGHHQVGDDEVGHKVQGFLQSLLSVIGIEDGAVVGKQRADVGGNVAVVLYDEQAAVVLLAGTVGGSLRNLGQERRVAFCRRHRLLSATVVDRHADVERGAFAHLALHGYRSIDGIHNLPDECQAHSRTDVLYLALVLIEWLEDIRSNFLVHALARIGNINKQLLVLAPCQHAHLSVFGRELEGIGEQVVHHLHHVVGYEVHDDFALGEELQVDVAAAGVASVAFHYHGEVGHDVSVLPVGIAHGRLYFRYVQQLVDECEQSFSLPFYGLCLVLHFCLACALQLSAQPQNYGQWRAELVRDVGEEVFAQCRHPFQLLMVAAAQPVGVEHHCQHSCQTQQPKSQHGIPYVACGALLFQSATGFVHLSVLSVAFYSQACVLNAVHLLHVEHAVLHCRCLFVRSQCRPVVARLFVGLII